MTEAGRLPAGKTLYHCPLCGPWTLAALPRTDEEITADLCVPPVEIALRLALAIEGELAAHLNTHPLLEWVQEVQRLREALEHAKAALTGDNEGIRLWMLDCGELVAKHRARADAAEKAAEGLLGMTMAEQPRTDSKADDPLGELRWELGARTRQYDRVCRDMRALTKEVISALSTDQHRMTMRGGLPFCECGLSLEGGDASGTFITHILAIWREGRS